MSNNNLLIIGAGEHGKVCKEIALALNVFHKISFLDDVSCDAIGKISDCKKFKSEYRYAVIGVGNNALRKDFFAMMREAEFELPILIHPSAFVSPSAEIGVGTVICPLAAINTGTKIGEGCIISAGAIVDHNTFIEDYVHINVGAICKSGSHVESCALVQTGQIVQGH